MRIVFIQAGDYAGAFHRLRDGDTESSHAQKYSMDYVASLCKRAQSVSVVCSSTTYDSVHLDNGIDAIGIEYFSGREGKRRHPERFIPALAQIQPTHIVLRQPFPEVMDWCTSNGVACLPLWADSYGFRFREFRFRRQLRRSLRESQIKWVSNHQIDACRTLTTLGLTEDVLIPWDWPQPVHEGAEFEPKQGLQRQEELSICYAGRIEAHKGVGDLIRAVKILKRRGHRVRLSLFGDGEDVHRFKKRVASLGLSAEISMPGKIPVSDVINRMNEHDIVVVPSRHYSNEGMPNTIRQAVRSRSPLVVSDHPAFSSVVIHEQNSVVFRAQRPASLATAIERLATDHALYRRLSNQNIQDLINKVPYWHRVIEHWLNEDDDWMSRHSLTSLTREPLTT